MTDVLIYSDNLHGPELRHEVPVPAPDPFLYVEKNGAKHVVITSFEVDRMKEVGLEAHPLEQFGWDELVGQGQRDEQLLKLFVRAVEGLDVKAATVPATFPLELADALRARGIEITPDSAFFAQRRRAKNEAELAGIRRAQRGTEAAMDAARDLFRRAEGTNGGLTVDGEPLTCELVKAAATDAFNRHGLVSDEMIVAHGAQTAVGHDMGSGPIGAGEPIILDLFPRDRESACFADMTRTFVIGEPPAKLVEFHRLVKEAFDVSLAAVAPGVDGNEVFRKVCDVFEVAGYPTQLSKTPGEVLDRGFYHGLGHGVGLEVHEQPSLSRDPSTLAVGDVITLEPGLYEPGFGGCRLEDLVLVTEDGCENLTQYAYDLTP
ncbi:MAG TPA: Xaa-Pro peptidase family protein [Gaiellaceae bacterium]|nr:Xaa-Pro peptidase family protein [Gaiellaceae bacterium]